MEARRRPMFTNRTRSRSETTTVNIPAPPPKPKAKFKVGTEVEIRNGMRQGQTGIIHRATLIPKNPAHNRTYRIHSELLTASDYTYRYSVKIGDNNVVQYRESGLTLATPLSEEELRDAQQTTLEMLRELKATSVS